MFRRREAQLDPEAKIAERFRALWELISPDCDGADVEFRAEMREQIRAALDRGRSNFLPTGPVEYIANSFTVEGVIAEGACTQVLAIKHRDLGTQHALKCAVPHMHADPLTRDLLIHEASTSLTLSNPHIARTQILLRLEDGRPALVMERCGPSLAQIIRKGEASARIVPQFLHSILTALNCVHEKGLVHGDVSPANILAALNDPERWLLCDFALCCKEGAAVPLSDLGRAGTAAFQSPEQAAGHALDRRSDLFALGRVLRWLLDQCPSNALAESEYWRLANELTRDDPADRPSCVADCLALLPDFG